MEFEGDSDDEQLLPDTPEWAKILLEKVSKGLLK